MACPSEVTGALGIGVLEAMARGIGVIISSSDLKCLNLGNKQKGIITYDSLEDLISIISNPPESRKTIFNGNIDISMTYSANQLLINAKDEFGIQ